MSDPIAVQRTIHADAAELYDMVSDLPRMGEWSPENTGGKWVKGCSGPCVGAHFRGSNRSGWRKWSTNVVVTTAEPGRRFSFDVTSGPVKVANWDYRFEPGNGETTVVETWTDRRPPVLGQVMGMIAGVRDRADANRRNMEATLAQLAAAAEQG